MRALVTFESIYGNTRAIADAVGEGLGSAGEVTVASQDQLTPEAVESADLFVVGAPTHMHGLPTSMSRKMAAQASEEEGAALDPSATAGPGIRAWLARQNGNGRAAAAFDTRIDRNPALTGSAARGIARRLRARGFEVGAKPESFFVDDSEGPLADGELERALEWGRALAGQVAGVGKEPVR